MAGQSLEIDADFNKQCLRRACLIGDWCIANQEKDITDANYGRFIDHYNPGIKYFNGKNILLTGSMMTGMGVNFLLMLYDRTGQNKYYEAEIRCGDFIKSLQCLYTGHPEIYGTVGEFSYQMIKDWRAYRSTTVAGDAFVLLYEKTGEQEYLDRAKLLADWFIKYAVAEEGWIIEDKVWQGGEYRFYFEIANLLFFYHLYKFDKNPVYLDLIKSMRNYFVEHFVREDGFFNMVLEKEHFVKNVLADNMNRAWWKQHLYNDDFSSVSLIGISHLLKDNTTLQIAVNYGNWLIEKQNPDGSIGEPPLWVGSATASITWSELFSATGMDKYKQASRKAIKHLMSLQELNSNDKRRQWAVYENNEAPNTVSVRTCAYGTIALLKHEGKITGPYLSAFDKEKKYFIKERL